MPPRESELDPAQVQRLAVPQREGCLVPRLPRLCMCFSCEPFSCFGKTGCFSLLRCRMRPTGFIVFCLTVPGRGGDFEEGGVFLSTTREKTEALRSGGQQLKLTLPC